LKKQITLKIFFFSNTKTFDGSISDTKKAIKTILKQYSIVHILLYYCFYQID